MDWFLKHMYKRWKESSAPKNECIFWALRNVETQNELKLERNGRELKALYFNYILRKNKKGIAAVFETDGLVLSDDKEKTKEVYFSLPKRKIFKLEIINQIRYSEKHKS